MRKIFSKINRQPRCVHRHTIKTHPNCFYKGGTPKITRDGKLTLPRILVFDIETSPLRAYIWQKEVWNARVGEDQVLSQWFMLTWSAKWLFGTEIMSERLTPQEATAEDDSRIVRDLWKLLDNSDIVIAHNGGRFDVPNMNTRFIVNNLPPTAPYQVIDTVLIARKQFGFTHNNLNALAKVFGLPTKKEMAFEDWKRCIGGDPEALKKMEIYNRGDVELLEEVYLKIRPWIRPHPNLGLYIDSDESICSNCGSTNLEMTDKFYYTSAGKYSLYKCECGAYIRVRNNSISKTKKEKLLVPVAK